MKKIVSYCIATVFTLFLLASTDSIAQGAPPGPLPPPPVGLPIDGGIVWLFLSGLLFAVTTLRKK